MTKTLKIKVCGMRDAENIRQLLTCGPDLIGFIFYPPSKRYVGEYINHELIDSIPREIIKTGVFVNEDAGCMIEKAKINKLNAIQLHGNESPDDCIRLKKENFIVIKAFRMDPSFNFNVTKLFENGCDYFLFDTEASGFGGSGEKFNWSLLTAYSGQVPFFLSGGINPGDVFAIKELNLPGLYGIDINSCFEQAPALKDIEKVRKFINIIRK